MINYANYPCCGIWRFPNHHKSPPRDGWGGGRRLTAMEKMLVDVDAVLRHEGEEVDAIDVVGEVGAVG